MKLILGLVLITAFSGFLFNRSRTVPVTKNISYGVGEELTYRVNFAFFTAALRTSIDKAFQWVGFAGFADHKL